MFENDLVRQALQPVADALRQAISAGQWHPRVAAALVDLIEVGEGALLISALALGGATLQAASQAAEGSSPRARRAIDAVYVLAALVAAGLLSWLISRPSSDVILLLGRYDHMTFAALAGCALGRLPVAWRTWALSALSLAFLHPATGPTPLAIVFGGGILGFLALRVPGLQRPTSTVLVQGTVLGGIYGACWWMQESHFFQALSTQGLFAFVLLRHISFVVETRRGQPASFGNYLCYMTFYPNCFGASEVYGEFAPRNLQGRPAFDYRTAAFKIMVGGVQIWLAKQMQTTFEVLVGSPTTPLLWLNVLLVFVRSSLYAMGLWAVIDGLALLYGFRLRPNFAGILTCQNPAQFWHAWRGTMTNWLVQYVYIPLGGNRRHQTRNIFAAFAVSTLWHCMGLPFITATVNPLQFVATGMWGALNAVAVAGYVLWRRQGYQVLPGGTPRVMRLGAKMFLTACLGTFTVTLLGFGAISTEHFPAFLRMLVGLGE